MTRWVDSCVYEAGWGSKQVLSLPGLLTRGGEKGCYLTSMKFSVRGSWVGQYPMAVMILGVGGKRRWEWLIKLVDCEIRDE